MLKHLHFSSRPNRMLDFRWPSVWLFHVLYPGMKYAMISMKLMICDVLRNFSLHTDTKLSDIRVKMNDAFTRKVGGYPITIRPRDRRPSYAHRNTRVAWTRRPPPSAVWHIVILLCNFTVAVTAVFYSYSRLAHNRTQRFRCVTSFSFLFFSFQ